MDTLITVPLWAYVVLPLILGMLTSLVIHLLRELWDAWRWRRVMRASRARMEAHMERILAAIRPAIRPPDLDGRDLV